MHLHYVENHSENKDQEIHGMKLSINAVETCNDFPLCMSMYKIQDTMQNDGPLQVLRLCHKCLATDKSRVGTRHSTILKIPSSPGSY